MLKKVVYGIVAGSLVFAAQGASAMTDDSPFPAQADAYVAPTHYRFESTPAAKITAIPWGAEALRDAAAPKGQPARQVQAQTQSSNSPFPPSAD